MKVSIIAAVSENGIIGNDGGLPWHISEDLKFFKRITSGKPVIMGRKTYESIGRPLPNRENIVVSSTMAANSDGVIVLRDLPSAIATGRELARDHGVEEIMIIGGASLYSEGIGLADRLYLTEVHAEIAGDTYFPVFDRNDWREVSRRPAEGRADDGPDYSFIALERVLG